MGSRAGIVRGELVFSFDRVSRLPRSRLYLLFTEESPSKRVGSCLPIPFWPANTALPAISSVSGPFGNERGCDHLPRPPVCLFADCCRSVLPPAPHLSRKSAVSDRHGSLMRAQTPHLSPHLLLAHRRGPCHRISGQICRHRPADQNHFGNCASCIGQVNRMQVLTSVLSVPPKTPESDDRRSSASAGTDLYTPLSHPFPAGFITLLDEPLSCFFGQVRARSNQSPNFKTVCTALCTAR